MSPGKAKYLAKAAKGYESHKKEKATTDMSKRIQRDLLPAIAAGQIDSLVQAGVIPREKQKKLTKNMVKRQASTLRKTQKKDNKRKHKSKRSRRERDRHSKKKKKHRSWSSSSSDSSDTSSSSSLSSSSSSASSSDSTSSSSSSSPGLARSKSKKSRRSKSKHSKKSKKKKKSTHRELPVAEEDDAEEALEDTPGSDADEEDPSKLIVAAIKDAAAEAVLTCYHIHRGKLLQYKLIYSSRMYNVLKKYSSMGVPCIMETSKFKLRRASVNRAG
jgi:hypothetical protein